MVIEYLSNESPRIWVRQMLRIFFGAIAPETGDVTKNATSFFSSLQCKWITTWSSPNEQSQNKLFFFNTVIHNLELSIRTLRAFPCQRVGYRCVYTQDFRRCVGGGGVNAVYVFPCMQITRRISHNIMHNNKLWRFSQQQCQTPKSSTPRKFPPFWLNEIAET